MSNRTVLVTGGAGYVGAVLVPKLLERGHRVRVLDLYTYGEGVLDGSRNHPRLEEYKGDLRDREALETVIPGCDAVIHLACISNDPSFELDPALGRSINYDAFRTLVEVSKRHKVRRFVYASTSSVYGIKEEPNVTEDLPLEPLTDYSKYKALCEEALLKERSEGFVPLILRPATVCGYSPRLRLDLTVNVLTAHAVTNRRITVFGGDQKRPNIHIDDVTDLYVKSLEWPDELIDGKVFNAGYENQTVNQLADTVRRVVGADVEIVATPSDDKRSYHISSEKIRRELGFIPRRTIEDAVRDLVEAFKAGKIPNPWTENRYHNIKTVLAQKDQLMNPQRGAVRLRPNGANELETIARELRYKVAEMIHESNTMHLGSCFSCIDALVAAYWGVLDVDPKNPDNPNRDRFLLSKGHAAPALFAALAMKGFFPMDRLSTYCKDGGSLAEHPTVGTPGVEAATGSLGHGLPLAIGMALAGRLQNRSYRTYALLSDGECNEGSTWEAALLAPAQRLDRLAAIVDFNKWQATGRSTEVTAMEPLAKKWEAFGWSVKEVDGHDIPTLLKVMRDVPDGSGKPVAIVAHTVKGKGVSFTEDDNNWHYRAPTAEELVRIRKELALA